MHKHYLSDALVAAQRYRGFTAPNPAVGAVIIDHNGDVVTTAAHQQAGQPHAEALALQQAQSHDLSRATLYITLEPCCHQGKTPPCTEAIIQSGIKTVYFAEPDPNPTAAGGAAILQQAGLHCEHISHEPTHRFYQSYRHWLNTQQPWVIAKISLSLDGKIAGLNGERLLLTGPDCQRQTHEQRCHSDAILTTVRTIVKDDPQLNVRLDSETIGKPVFIIDRRLQLPHDARILKTATELTLFYQAGNTPNDLDSKLADRLAALTECGVHCVPVSADLEGLAWPEMMSHMGAQGYHDLWVEAGGRCFQSLWQRQQLHRALIYVAPIVLGARGYDAFDQAFSLLEEHLDFSVIPLGSDIVYDIDFTCSKIS